MQTLSDKVINFDEDEKDDKVEKKRSSQIPIVPPKKITIGLSASITFKIVN